MVTNFYAVLGLPQNATTRQVRERFLELARERHPDRFQGDEKQKAETEFQEVTQAFNVLTDPERRRQLDAELAQPSSATAPAAESSASKVYFQRGLKAFRANLQNEAIENFEQATREDPGNAPAWHYLGRASKSIPSLRTKARTAAITACELESMNPTYLELAGRLCADQGLPGQAAKYLRGAIDWGEATPELEEIFRASLAAAKSE